MRRDEADDRGSSVIEVLLLTPLLVFFLLAVVQVGLVVQARQATQDAALAAARAYQLTESDDAARQAAADAVPPGFRPVTVTAADGSPSARTAAVQVRRVLPFVDVVVRRTARLP